MPYIEGSIQRGGAPGTAGAGGSVACRGVTYDFAVNGGATGTINLLAAAGAGLVPSGSIVTSARVDVLSPLVGAGASVALQVQGVGDLQTAAAVSGAPWSTTGVKQTLTGGTIKLTAPRDIGVVISGAPLTAGKFTVYLDYIAGSN